MSRHLFARQKTIGSLSSILELVERLGASVTRRSTALTLYTPSMETFLRYIELVLTAVGLLVVIAVFAMFHNIAPWEAAAICAVAVSVVHGAIFFAVRAMQR